MKNASVIASRYDRNSKRTFYVANLPGDGGKDWGYTMNAKDALLLNAYWSRRFQSNCRKVGVEATLFARLLW